MFNKMITKELIEDHGSDHFFCTNCCYMITFSQVILIRSGIIKIVTCPGSDQRSQRVDEHGAHTAGGERVGLQDGVRHTFLKRNFLILLEILLFSLVLI